MFADLQVEITGPNVTSSITHTSHAEQNDKLGRCQVQCYGRKIL